MSANTQWLASARAKLGFTGWWNTMFYATGGVAWANIEYAAQESNEPPTFATDFRSTSRSHTIKTGWVAGGGAEWMATTNILLRAEYLYYNINNGTRPIGILVPKSRRVSGGRSTTIGPTITYTSSGSRRATSSELRLGSLCCRGRAVGAGPVPASHRPQPPRPPVQYVLQPLARGNARPLVGR